MKIILVILYFALFGLNACVKVDSADDVSDKNQRHSTESKAANAVVSAPTPPKKISPNKLPVPRVSDFSIQGFFRRSDKKDLRLDRIPPFVYGEISFFVQSKKVKIGDSVTAVWLEGAEKNLTLKVKSVKRVPFLDCDAEKIGSEVEFGRILDKTLLEMKPSPNRIDDQPFDFFLIYPAVKNARKLNKQEITKAMLPESVSVEQVVAAIDLNDDGAPDLLVSNYCCYDSSQCDCTSSYQKINSEWKYLSGSEPC